MKSYCISALLVIVMMACNGDETLEGVTVNMRVNSYTEPCIGLFEGTCLLVQEGDLIGTETWEYFYYETSIEGFNYEAGYIYNLQVRKVTIKNPPMDASGIEYKLEKIISKEKV